MQVEVFDPEFVKRKRCVMRVFSPVVLCLIILVPGVLLGQGLQYAEAFIGSAQFEDYDDRSIGIRTGYAFSDRFSVEIGYVDFGTYEETFFVGDGDPTCVIDCGGEETPPVTEFSIDSLTSLNIGIMGSMPWKDNISLHARAGLAMWEAEGSLTDGISGDILSGSNDGDDIYFGVGARIDVSATTYLTADYWMVDADGADLSTITAGVGFSF